jgi:transposase-like protein
MAKKTSKKVEPEKASVTETPIVAPPKPEKTVAVTCSHGCGGVNAVEVVANESSPSRVYKCTSCNKTWTVPIGMPFNI